MGSKFNLGDPDVRPTSSSSRIQEVEGNLPYCRYPIELWDKAYKLTEHYLQIVGQKTKKRQVVVYCRVSSAGQKKDLISQKNAVESFCLSTGKAMA